MALLDLAHHQGDEGHANANAVSRLAEIGGAGQIVDVGCEFYHMQYKPVSKIDARFVDNAQAYFDNNIPQQKPITMEDLL